jgi:hypothetical protein
MLRTVIADAHGVEVEGDQLGRAQARRVVGGREELERESGAVGPLA